MLVYSLRTTTNGRCFANGMFVTTPCPTQHLGHVDTFQTKEDLKILIHITVRVEVK